MQVMDWTGLDWTGWKFNREKTGTDQPEYTIPHTRSWILTWPIRPHEDPPWRAWPFLAFITAL